MSQHFRQRMAGSFGLTERSDCMIKFILESSVKARKESGGRENPGSLPHMPSREIGQPLPAHQFALSWGSSFFDAQLQRWSKSSVGVEAHGGHATAQEKGRKRKAPQPSTALQEAGNPSSPELLVHLRSEDERPAAEAAIKFIYTDALDVSGISCAELLRVRRQASYLQVEGCVAACDEALFERVRDDGAAALQIHRCEALFPQPEEEAAGFAAVLEAAKPALLRGLLADYSSAPAVLNSPQLQDRFDQLPAAAVEALLASNKFATDDESSVLLLLFGWRAANVSMSPEVYERLCRLVRLVQLSDSYLSFVLHSMNVPSPLNFAISQPELLFAREYKAAGGTGAFAEMAHELHSAKETRWYAGPRSQAVPVAGTAFDWHIPKQELADAVKALAAHSSQTEVQFVYATISLPSGASAKRVCSRGWEWGVFMKLRKGENYAGMYLKHCIPRGLPMAEAVGAMIPFARLAVHRWRGGTKEVGWSFDFGRKEAVWMNRGRGLDSALRLRSALPAAPRAGGSGGGAAAAAPSADPPGDTFDDWLHDDKITGTVVFKRE